VDIGIVTVSVETSVEDKRCVHEGAGVDKTTALTNLHLFNIENETTVKDLESHSTLASKDQDLVLSNLISQTHIGWNPFAFVYDWSRDFLPNVS
jgi:hypothetical protein